MSSTSRPHTTGTSSNIPPGQSPSKAAQNDNATNQLAPQNVAQTLYQNNPNQQFIPNNIPLINSAQQLQFQSQITNFQQTAAFLQRQQQFLQYTKQQQQLQQQQQQQPQQSPQHHHQQQQQQQPQQQQHQQLQHLNYNSTESQLKNQQLSNGPLASFPNFPELLNLFQLFQSNTNSPLPQLLQSQVIPPVQQQPLQTPKTLPVTPPKLSHSQHIPRSLITSPQSVTINAANTNNAQTAEINSGTGTSVIPPIIPSETPAENPKLTLSTEASSESDASSPSLSITGRVVEEVKEGINVEDAQPSSTTPVSKKILRDEIAPIKSISPLDIAQDSVLHSETNQLGLPRRKQTNATNNSPIKSNLVISSTFTSGPTNDSLAFSTPKKSIAAGDVSTSLPFTPVGSVTAVAPTTPAEKKIKQSNEESNIQKEANVQKITKKTDAEPKSSSSTADDPKPSTSTSKESNANSIEDLTVTLEVKSKRHRLKTSLYQSPTPELVLATKMSVTEAYANSNNTKDKLIVFYTDEFLAVRNDEGSFFLCQCVNNVYKSTKKCSIRWLNRVEHSDDIYNLSFYDKVDMECILTSLELDILTTDSYKLSGNERERIENILKKSLDVEKGLVVEVTEGNPDGLDISLFKNESQISNLKSSDDVTPKRKIESSSKSQLPAKKVRNDSKSSKQRRSLNRNSRSKNDSTDDTNDKILEENGTSSRSSKKRTSIQQSRRSQPSLSNSKSPSLYVSTTDDESPLNQAKKPKHNSKATVARNVVKAKKTSKSPQLLSKSPSTSTSPSSRRLRKRNDK